MPYISIPPLKYFCYNKIITQNISRNIVRLVDVAPVLKKEDSSLLKNYRPVSVSPAVSKIYKRIMRKLVLKYIDKHSFSYLCGYKKGYSIQKALTSMLEKWRLFIDKKALQVIYNRLE